MGDGVEAEHDAFLSAIRSSSQPPHAIDTIAPSLFLSELIEAGFSGRVQLPVAEVAAIRQPREAAGKSVLVTQPAGLQTALSRWLPPYQLVSLDDVRESSGQRPEVVAAILGRGSAALEAEVLDKLPGLEVVGITGLSFAHFAPEQLVARGITLVNASAAHAGTVAEFALGLAILGRRGAFVSHAVIRRGGWGTRMQTTGFTGFVERCARALRPAVKAIGLEPALLRTWQGARPVSGASVHADPRDLQGAVLRVSSVGARTRELSASAW